MLEKMRKDIDVYLIGRYFCDLIFTGLPEVPRLGHEVYSEEFRLAPGGVANPAIAMTRLGLNLAWPCQFGSDPFSQHVKNEIIKEEVNPNFFTETEDPSIRITVAFSFEKERAFLSYTDPLPAFPHEDLIRETHPKWVYITHLLYGKAQEKITGAARDVGAKVFMDCQAHSTTLDDALVADALRRVDVFSPNAEEALCLTAEKDLDNAARTLAQLTPLVIIKRGAHGCSAFQSGKHYHCSSINVKVKDTTGAGDNFNCGFLYSQINGKTLEESLRIANICGALSTRGHGGSATSPTGDEIDYWLNKTG